MQDPQPEFQPQAGVAELLEPGLRRILAPNPSPMTFRGTNTYLVGEGDVAVVDPGPVDDRHLGAILAALKPGERISHVLVTHAHLDHSPLAHPLARQVGAPVLAFGGPEAGRSPTMQRLAREGLLGGGEGVDTDFLPDEFLADGDSITTGCARLEALHTPGHMANHLAFAFGDALLSGDLVMGWATSLVSPPDGDLAAFMASLRRLQTRQWRRFHPGHGAPVDDPAKRLSELLTHRMGREASILAALSDGPATATELATRIYADTPPPLLPAAARNVLAHLIDLSEQFKVTPNDGLNFHGRFQILRDG